MKVYILVSSYDNSIEGVYTSDGKRARHKQLVEEAQIDRIRHIEELEKIRNECTIKAVYFYNEAANLLCVENAIPRISELLTKRDFWESESKAASKTIDSLNQMSVDDVLRVYGCPYYWEERELIGN